MGFMGYSVPQSTRVNVLEWSTELLLIAPRRAGFTVSVGKTEISVLFSVFATHREANFGPENR